MWFDLSFLVTVLFVDLFIIETYPFTLIPGHVKEEGNKFCWTTRNPHIYKNSMKTRWILFVPLKSINKKLILFIIYP